jgi:hypothetical protein
MKKLNLIFISLLIFTAIAGSMEARHRGRHGRRGYRGHRRHHGHHSGSGVGAFFGALLYHTMKPSQESYESKKYYENVRGLCTYCNKHLPSPITLKEHIHRFHPNRFYDCYSR